MYSANAPEGPVRTTIAAGKKDGDIKVINEGGAGVAYSWDSAR